MNNLNFDTGYKEYSINGDESKVIRIDTTDYALFDRIQKVSKNIDKLSENYRNTKVETDEQANELFVKVDKDIREQINKIFGYDVSSVVFGITNCMSITKSGHMLFENFLNALIPVIKNDMQEAVNKQNERVKKYTSQIPKATK